VNQTATGNHRETESTFPGDPIDYHGFARHDFTVDNCPAIVVGTGKHPIESYDYRVSGMPNVSRKVHSSRSVLSRKRISKPPTGSSTRRWIDSRVRHMSRTG